jgi:periplasmic divalent cation tolerance protein
MGDAVVCLCTCPDADTAQRLAQHLVASGLAACVNRVPGLLSVFRWEGQIEETSEVLLIIKTLASHVDALAAAIREIHPYEVPELVALPIVGGHRPYLDWLKASVA